jgi:hypothetical protein
MRGRVILSVTVLFAAVEAWTQSPCPCNPDYWASVPDSTLGPALITHYILAGVPAEQLQKVKDCIGPLPTSFKLDNAFREKLCTCGPDGFCFEMFSTDPLPEGYAGPSVLYIHYRRHPTRTSWLMRWIRGYGSP